MKTNAAQARDMAMRKSIGPGALYFDSSDFAVSVPATFGNEGRNILSGPRIVNLDMGISRKFPIVESMGGEFRMESFHFADTPHCNNPSGALRTAIVAFGNRGLVSWAPEEGRSGLGGSGWGALGSVFRA